MTNILDSQTLINGNTQQKLSDQWWVQAYSIPVNANPFITDDAYNPRGRRGSIELHENFQSSSPRGVTFLGGTLPGSQVAIPAVRTIVGKSDTVYFAPFANLLVDNTTTDFSPNSGFPGGYALTPQHLADLTARGLYPRDLTSLAGVPTLLDYARSAATFSGQFVTIDGDNATPSASDIQNYKQATKDVSYAQLPRSTGAFNTKLYSTTPDGIFVADPDLGENLTTPSPNDDTFPTLARLNPNLKKYVAPFVQAGDYFGFKLESGAHTVHFGATGAGQDITYNVLNEVKGTNQDNTLRGTDCNDYIDGRNGKDQLLGFGGDDLIIGGNGKDLIDGGKGNDELWGGKGKDTFIFKQGYRKDTIFDFERGGTIQINGFSGTPSVTDITLLSGSKATQIQFNNDDILTLVGVKSHDLSINLSAGKIAF